MKLELEAGGRAYGAVVAAGELRIGKDTWREPVLLESGRGTALVPEGTMNPLRLKSWRR